jgi:hypothetical protein
MTAAPCKNCGEAMQDRHRYCPVCGQSVLNIRRPWSAISRELLRELFDLDGRMIRSLRLLLGHPGYLTRQYMDGRRASYTPPLRMYLVISLAFFLLLPLVIPDSPDPGPARAVSIDRYSRAMFLMLPVFALLLKLFYRRDFYLVHLVFTLHLFSAMFIGFVAIMSIEAAADRYLTMIFVQSALLLGMVVYCVAALRTAYGESWLSSTVKFLGLLVLFLPVLAGVIELAGQLDF